jgi:hypothetical protein
MKSSWQEALVLEADRTIRSGTEAALAKAIQAGADLRIYTEFRHNEHADPSSDSAELVREVSEFSCTYLVERRWTAGIITLRQPVELPDRFGPRPSMSFFMYNQDGQQAIARPFLDGGPISNQPGASPVAPHPEMPKFHEQDSWDKGTNAPSSNFIYDFDVFRYFVRDDWQEVLSHDAHGKVQSGSIDMLSEAFTDGLEVKVGIEGLCADLDDDPTQAPVHEVFIRTGSGYYYTKEKLFVAGTHPLARVRPAIPMKYASRTWDFGWLITRTDGRVAQLLYDPYTLAAHRREERYSMRWFVR